MPVHRLALLDRLGRARCVIIPDDRIPHRQDVRVETLAPPALEEHVEAIELLQAAGLQSKAVSANAALDTAGNLLRCFARLHVLVPVHPTDREHDALILLHDRFERVPAHAVLGKGIPDNPVNHGGAMGLKSERDTPEVCACSLELSAVGLPRSRHCGDRTEIHRHFSHVVAEELMLALRRAFREQPDHTVHAVLAVVGPVVGALVIEVLSAGLRPKVAAPADSPA
eukprot:7048667-Prymnesium_polylepis.1